MWQFAETWPEHLQFAFAVALLFAVEFLIADVLDSVALWIAVWRWQPTENTDEFCGTADECPQSDQCSGG